MDAHFLKQGSVPSEEALDSTRKVHIDDIAYASGIVNLRLV